MAKIILGKAVLFLVAVILGGIVLQCEGDKLVGGLTSEKVADEMVKNIIAQIEEEIVQKIAIQGRYTALKNIPLKPVSYKVQLVNGINYFVKVRVQVGKTKSVYYAVRIYRDFEGKNVTFLGIQPIHKNSEIESF